MSAAGCCVSMSCIWVEKRRLKAPLTVTKKMMACDEFKFLKKHQANQFGTSVRL
ncbi:hypothetical protein OAN307_c18350 [Octadecabacter antarcticus 307]|uniref:Uncharacterized protein n=1 Tax=Octadecabacter antarcticus 307 TaxID=391626 RepID=M9RAX4_9RHOB|nr:hypothetical protein OAN307_c18350 [Octadecabacter antarcticus 307]